MSVASLLQSRVSLAKIPIFAVMVPGTLKGYIFVESAGPHFVDDAAAGVKHARQRVPGLLKLSEVERYIITKPVIEELSNGDTVEVVAGPLKGMRAKITKIDKGKSEITLELLESAVALPITVHADYVRLVERAPKRE